MSMRRPTGACSTSVARARHCIRNGNRSRRSRTSSRRSAPTISQANTNRPPLRWRAASSSATGSATTTMPRISRSASRRSCNPGIRRTKPPSSRTIACAPRGPLGIASGIFWKSRRQQVNYPELKRAVMALARQWRATVILIEDRASGTQLLQELPGRRALRSHRHPTCGRQSDATPRTDRGDRTGPGVAPATTPHGSSPFSTNSPPFRNPPMTTKLIPWPRPSRG